VARRTERTVVAVIVSLWMCAASARDQMTGIVAGLRARGCSGGAGTSVALQPDAALDAIARRLSAGGRLQDAIAAERYAAQKSSSISIRPVSSPEAVASLLQSSHCATLTNPEFTRIGVAHKGDSAWIVLAMPFAAPAAVSAESTGARVLELVNAARSKPRRCGLRRYDTAPPVRLDAVLARIAAGHSRDMARHSRMSHTGSDGTTIAERATAAGYPWRFVSENVAAGQTTAEEVIVTWLESSGHCANLMDPAVQEMGVAVAFDPSSMAGTYWTQVFAARK
jgi:uncharacterized protein YkwD